MKHDCKLGIPENNSFICITGKFSKHRAYEDNRSSSGHYPPGRKNPGHAARVWRVQGAVGVSRREDGTGRNGTGGRPARDTRGAERGHPCGAQGVYRGA